MNTRANFFLGTGGDDRPEIEIPGVPPVLPRLQRMQEESDERARREVEQRERLAAEKLVEDAQPKFPASSKVLTVGQLIEQLQAFDLSLPVRIEGCDCTGEAGRVVYSSGWGEGPLVEIERVEYE